MNQSDLRINKSLQHLVTSIGLSLTLILLLAVSDCFANGPIIQENFFVVNIDDCDAMGEVCIDLPFGDASNYDFLVDNVPYTCLLYTSPSPRDGLLSRMPSSA